MWGKHNLVVVARRIRHGTLAEFIQRILQAFHQPD